jgi:quinol monooxygenase YgiN
MAITITRGLQKGKAADRTSADPALAAIVQAGATQPKRGSVMAIVIIARMKAKAGREQELEKAFREMITKVRSEPGCQQYILHRALKDPTQFAFFEVYADKEALDFHGKTPHMTELRGKLADMIDSTTLDIMTEIDRR